MGIMHDKSNSVLNSFEKSSFKDIVLRWYNISMLYVIF